MGKNLEEVTEENHNIKKKIGSKILPYGLALALFALPFFPRKSDGKMIYNKIHSIPMYRESSPKYERIDPVDVRVRVDTMKKDKSHHSVYFSIFTENYNLRMPNLNYYEFISNSWSKLCIAYSDNLTINPYKIKQRCHEVFKKRIKDKNMHCEWKTLTGESLEMPLPKTVREIKKIVDTLTFFLIPKNKVIDELIEDYHLMEIPFYQSNKNTSARMFIIPVEIKRKGESELKFLSNISLERIGIPNRETGSKKLMINLDLK